MKFTGTYTALITPFQRGRVDEAAFKNLVREQIRGGVDGIVPTGTTGESPTLEFNEHIRVIELAVQTAKGKIKVLAGTGANSTAEAIELTQAAEAVGADGSLLVAPYYNKPSQEGLFQHFKTIGKATKLPIVLYSIPGRCNIAIEVATVTRLAKACKNIVGIKEATGDLGRASELRRRCGPDFTLLSGDDFSLLPFLSAGGHGVISVVSNVLPGMIAQICETPSGALSLHDLQFQLTEALFAAPNPVPTKLALAQLKLCQADVRSPLVELSDEHPLHARMRALLQEIHHDQ